MDSYLGEIRILPYTFAPANWALCTGQQVAIQQNSALYSLISITYGGDGQSTFKLPNIPGGSAVIGAGQGPGLTNRIVGPTAIGSVTAVLSSISSMPNHSHEMHTYAPGASQATPVFTGVPSSSTRISTAENPGNLAVFGYNHTNPVDTQLSAASVGPAGTGQPHPNEQPYLAMGYYISLYGEYPSFP
jgi:microcystin-dependent protein